jgi:hypothetical protein
MKNNVIIGAIAKEKMNRSIKPAIHNFPNHTHKGRNTTAAGDADHGVFMNNRVKVKMALRS